MTRTIGIDFGTTNTVVSLGDSGEAELVAYPFEPDPFVAFRSALSFQRPHDDPKGRIVEAGPWAIDAYIEEPAETRFIQSFKSYAASPLFTETRILDRRYVFEDMLSAFLMRVRAHAAGRLDDLPPQLVVGRPVTFAGLQPKAELALERYQAAFARLGFTDIRYAYEPVAAAFFFARQLKADATVLVADFGGGTSDFSLVRFERLAGKLKSTALSNAGVGVAGDAFDYRIIDNLVSPKLGKGTNYRAFDNRLPVPNRYYAAFARWEQLALLRTSRDMRDIRALVRTADEPDKIARLVEVLDGNLGYPLYRAVTALKEQLSSAEEARFSFVAGDVRIEGDVRRPSFERWITPELTAMEAAVDLALERANLTPGAVDRVFLTGGSSFVPAVRAIFERRFGPAKLDGGAELTSIASGLALMGDEDDLDAWTERAPA